ncbi:divergent paired-related homeobox [Odocoileus virginianus]|uniref:Divergent paired-related homeobox n=1 Tax=Odocoileus virginianus TaxID=9874 RepID=A0ABM4HUL4_ODOVR
MENKTKQNNPYPTLGLQREMASKMELHPTVLQDWFKNHRVKFKKARDEDFPSEHGQYWLRQGERGSTSQVLSGAFLESLVPTGPQTPSFQLSTRPAPKDLVDHSLGHKMVRFGCCQDPNIYCLYTTVEP